MRTRSVNHAIVAAASQRRRSLTQVASAADGIRAASSPVVPGLMARFEGVFSQFLDTSKPASDKTGSDSAANEQ